MTITPPATPGTPVLAILVDAEGQIVLIGKISGDARLSELRNQLTDPPPDGDLSGGGLSLAFEATRVPKALEEPLYEVTTKVKWCVDKFGNIVVCRPRP